jgi:Tfp pilus assembly protein PilF
MGATGDHALAIPFLSCLHVGVPGCPVQETKRMLLLAFAVFELVGQLTPETRASVTLHGATTPFSESTLANSRGRFRFRKIQQGTYTLSAFAPGVGEASQTVAIGPGTAERSRVSVVVRLRETREAITAGAKISVRELSIPDGARREFDAAQEKLSKRDVEGANEHLRRAVEIAPQFSAAWNNLGTIAYQTQRYPEAEGYFRRALDEEPGSFAPLVNLGGVLLNLKKLKEALKYNRHAVLNRPEDALANSQLGMTYFETGELDLARKYLEAAKTLDPAHFSRPQIVLAEVHLRRGDPLAAAAELESFLKYHPDSAGGERLRKTIEKLRSGLVHQ